jgi:hypothetical protein
MGFTPCARGAVARTVSGCIRGVATLTLADDSAPWIMFLTSLILPVILIPVANIFRFYKSPQLYWAYYGVGGFFFVAITWTTFRQLIDPQGIAANYVLGILGLPIVILFLGLQVLWRFKAVQRLRFREFAWADGNALSRLGVTPRGVWEPENIFKQNRTMLNTLSRDGLSMVIFPHAVAFVAAIVIANTPTGPAGCSSMYALLAVWYVLVAFFIFVNQIYATMTLNILASLTSLFVATAALGGIVQASKPGDGGPMLYHAGIGGVTVCMLLRLTFRFYCWCLNDQWKAAQ